MTSGDGPSSRPCWPVLGSGRSRGGGGRRATGGRAVRRIRRSTCRPPGWSRCAARRPETAGRTGRNPRWSDRWAHSWHRPARRPRRVTAVGRRLALAEALRRVTLAVALRCVAGGGRSRLRRSGRTGTLARPEGACGVSGATVGRRPGGLAGTDLGEPRIDHCGRLQNRDDEDQPQADPLGSDRSRRGREHGGEGAEQTGHREQRGRQRVASTSRNERRTAPAGQPATSRIGR